MHFKVGDLVKIVGNNHPMFHVTVGKIYPIIGWSSLNNGPMILNDRQERQLFDDIKYPNQDIVRVNSEQLKIDNRKVDEDGLSWSA